MATVANKAFMPSVQTKELMKGIWFHKDTLIILDFSEITGA